MYRIRLRPRAKLRRTKRKALVTLGVKTKQTGDV